MSEHAKKNDPGYAGWNERGEQQCLTCWGWKFPVIHSCPGVPQAGRVRPPRHLAAVDRPTA